MIIKNCILTNSDVEVFTEGDKAFGVYKGSVHTGVDTKATSVFSLSQGVIVSTYSNDKTYSVIVQYDSNKFIRYSNLTYIQVVKGSTIEKGSKIGDCKSVHLEYLRRDKSDIPITINLFGMKLYPNNPVPLLTQEETLKSVYIPDPEEDMYDELVGMGSGE